MKLHFSKIKKKEKINQTKRVRLNCQSRYDTCMTSDGVSPFNCNYHPRRRRRFLASFTTESRKHVYNYSFSPNFLAFSSPFPCNLPLSITPLFLTATATTTTYEPPQTQTTSLPSLLPSLPQPSSSFCFRRRRCQAGHYNLDICTFGNGLSCSWISVPSYDRRLGFWCTRGITY